MIIVPRKVCKRTFLFLDGRSRPSTWSTAVCRSPSFLFHFWWPPRLPPPPPLLAPAASPPRVTPDWCFGAADAPAPPRPAPYFPDAVVELLPPRWYTFFGVLSTSMYSSLNLSFPRRSLGGRLPSPRPPPPPPPPPPLLAPAAPAKDGGGGVVKRKSCRLRYWMARARARSTRLGWHNSHRYSSGMLLRSRLTHSTCCQTLLSNNSPKMPQSIKIELLRKQQWTTYEQRSQQIM